MDRCSSNLNCCRAASSSGQAPGWCVAKQSCADCTLSDVVVGNILSVVRTKYMMQPVQPTHAVMSCPLIWNIHDDHYESWVTNCVYFAFLILDPQLIVKEYNININGYCTDSDHLPKIITTKLSSVLTEQTWSNPHVHRFFVIRTKINIRFYPY